MPLKNRHAKEPRLRLPQNPCPCCSSPCVVYQSVQQTVLTRLFYLRCTNHFCGWTGAGVFEIRGTIQKPSRFYKGADHPPEINGEILDAVSQEIEMKKDES